MTEAAQLSAEMLQKADDLLSSRQLSLAIRSFLRAEQLGAAPDRCAAGRWQASMLAGDFAAAWRESDAIRLRAADDPHRFWNGEPIEGKRVILRCLHGLGDAVQMLRYLPLLQAQCAVVVIEVPPRLLPLAAFFAGTEHVITWGEHAPAKPPGWEVQVEIMELPHLFRTTLSDLPVAERYLCLPFAATQQMARSLGPVTKPRVGVVWSASEWDSTRCLPIDCLARLLAFTGIEFWNLQGGVQHDMAMSIPAPGCMRDAAPLGDGLVALAATIQNMDLVITVDTLAAHLAGALGRDAWVLLQHRADWRWMCERDDSPWYPTSSLMWQPAPGDWDSLTSHVCKMLERWLGERR